MTYPSRWWVLLGSSHCSSLSCGPACHPLLGFSSRSSSLQTPLWMPAFNLSLLSLSDSVSISPLLSILRLLQLRRFASRLIPPHTPPPTSILFSLMSFRAFHIPVSTSEEKNKRFASLMFMNKCASQILLHMSQIISATIANRHTAEDYFFFSWRSADKVSIHDDKSWENCSTAMIFPQPVLPQSSQTLKSTQKERPRVRCQGEFSRCFSLVTGNLANVTTAWHGVAPRHARPHSSRCGSACREASTAVSAALCQLRAFRTAAGKISARLTRCTTAAIHARQKPFALNVYIKESIRKEWKYSCAWL